MQYEMVSSKIHKDKFALRVSHTRQTKFQNYDDFESYIFFSFSQITLHTTIELKKSFKSDNSSYVYFDLSKIPVSHQQQMNVYTSPKFEYLFEFKITDDFHFMIRKISKNGEKNHQENWGIVGKVFPKEIIEKSKELSWITDIIFSKSRTEIKLSYSEFIEFTTIYFNRAKWDGLL